MLKKLVISLVVTALCAPALAQKGQKISSPEGAVYDATGKRIGPFSPTSPPSVLANVGGTLAYLSLSQMFDPAAGVFPDARLLVPNGDGSAVYFESAQCAGPAYLSMNSAWRGMNRSVTLGDGLGAGILYIGAPGVPVTKTLLSKLTSLPSNCNAVNSTEAVVPVTQAVDLGSVFAVPYSVR